MAGNPIVTIITVVRNDKEGFLATARCVLKQSYKFKEWIVIDGNSTDGTSDYVRALRWQTSRYVIENDTGIYNAMNKGISFASGEWTIFLNAGDILSSEDTIQKYVNFIKSDDELIYADALDRSTGKVHPYRDISEACLGMFCDHQSLLTRTSILKKYRFDESLRIAGDYDFVLRAKSNGYKFRKIPGFVVCVKSFSKGMSSRYMDRQMERVVVIKRYCDNEFIIKPVLDEYSKELENNNISNEDYIFLIDRLNRN